MLSIIKMIIERKMYACKCDNCGKDWNDNWLGIMSYNDKGYMEFVVQDDETWHCEDRKHYCPDCWSFDDEGEVVVSQK